MDIENKIAKAVRDGLNPLLPHIISGYVTNTYATQDLGKVIDTIFTGSFKNNIEKEDAEIEAMMHGTILQITNTIKTIFIKEGLLPPEIEGDFREA